MSHNMEQYLHTMEQYHNMEQYLHTMEQYHNMEQYLPYTSQPATLLPGLPPEIRSVKYKAIMLQLYLHGGIYVGLGWFQLR